MREFLVDWMRNAWTSPQQIIASLMLEHGITVNLELLNEYVFLSFPQTTAQEVSEIRKSFLRNMILREEIHYKIYREFPPDRIPSRDAIVAFVNRELVGQITDPALRLRELNRRCRAVEIWLKYCIFPLHRGLDNCSYIELSTPSGSQLNVWMLMTETQSEYLSDELLERNTL
jgi:hypothetical protein